MRDLTQKDLTEGDLANQIILPPSDSRQESISLYLEHRDFTTGVELESYVFQDWEADGPYTQFKPLRSKIRQLKSHGYSNTQLIRGLGEAILFVYEKGLVPNPHLLDQELYEKNKSMSTALDRALDTVNGVSPSQ